jgi:hypothetical protein
MAMMKIYRFFMLRIVGQMNWTGWKYLFTGREYDLEPHQIKEACEILKAQNCVGLSYKSTHFTSFLIMLGHFLMTGHWIKWCHAWMNIEGDIKDSKDLEIYESISAGLVKSPFWKVFNSDAIILLKPKNLSEEQWQDVLQYLKDKLGTPYDICMDEQKDDQLNCVETVVRSILRANPNALPIISRMMKRYGQLTPAMLLYGDFEIVAKFKGRV